MKDILRIYNKYKEIINYLFFGGLTTVINLISYYILTFSILDANNEFELQIANVIAWIVSVIFAYITNRKFVFISKSKNIKKEIISFFGARVVTLFFDMVFMFIGVSLLSQNDKVIKLISQILVIISNYLFSKLFVFKNRVSII